MTSFTPLSTLGAAALVIAGLGSLVAPNWPAGHQGPMRMTSRRRCNDRGPRLARRESRVRQAVEAAAAWRHHLLVKTEKESSESM